MKRFFKALAIKTAVSPLEVRPIPESRYRGQRAAEASYEPQDEWEEQGLEIARGIEADAERTSPTIALREEPAPERGQRVDQPATRAADGKDRVHRGPPPRAVVRPDARMIQIWNTRLTMLAMLNND